MNSSSIKLPPVINESYFKAVDCEDREEIIRRIAPLMKNFHTFLNDLPCMRDIQYMRKSWKARAYADVAFGTIASNPRECYSFNHGGRNEAQFNICIMPTMFHIGLGFEFTLKKGGDPGIVGLTYACFQNVIRDDIKNFTALIQANSLELEWWHNKNDGLQIVPTSDVAKWLLKTDGAFFWILVGKILRRDRDAAILQDPVQMKKIFESVLGGLKPYWEKTQKMTERNR